MNFNTAIRKLKRGLKVRRPVWDKDSYWILGKDEVITWNNKKQAYIHINQIEAEDWEIFVEEEFCLSNERIITRDTDSFPCYSEKDIKKLIKIVKAYDKNKLFGNDFIVISKLDFNKLLGDKLNGI